MFQFNLSTMNNTSQESQILTQSTPDFAIFQEQLTTFTAPEVPYFNRLPKSPQRPVEVRPVAVPDVMAEIDPSSTPVWDWQIVLFTAFAVYLARLCQTNQLDLGFKPLQSKSIEDGSAIHIPLRLTLDLEANFDQNYKAVEQQLEATMHHFQDWCAQFPALSTPPTYSVVIAQVEHPQDYQPLSEVGLTLLIASTGEVLWLYNLAQLSDPQGLQMLKQFITLQESLATQWNAPIWQLPLLNATERHQLLIEWNNTATPYPADKCIHQLFEEQVERTPDQVAVVFEEKQLTYQELNQRANQLAHYLITLGVQADSLVGICVERSMEMVIGLLGILKAGGAYVPLEPAYPKERLTFMLTDAQVSVLLTQTALQAKLPATTAQIVCLDAGLRSPWVTFNQQNPSVLVQPHNLAYVIYTSGSTGHPKGALIVHQGVVRLVRHTNYINIDEQEVFLQLAPLAFDASTLEVWAPLLNGGHLAVMSPGPASLSDIGQAIHHYGVTTLWLTASLFHLMVEERLTDLQPLHQLLAGGDVLAVPQVNKAVAALTQGRLINGYGPTENTTFTCCYTIPKHTVITGSVPIGKPIANTQVYILDSWMQPVPVGVVGELYIGGAGLAREYLNQPELTAAKFVPNPYGEGRLYKTGDRVQWLPEGNIEFLGRFDHQVKLRGFRIELGEIEATLTSHSAVREAVAMLREDSLGEPSLTAYLVPTNADTTTQHEYVEQWQSLYEETYKEVSASAKEDLSFNIQGWNSSYTGGPIPAEEMAEWVENTVAELQALSATNILEIGCGTGLLLARLAPHCDQYWGLDYSHQVIAQVQRLTQTMGLENVTLQQRVADDFTGIPTHTFDLVIINSVVQYFPSLDYLQRVIEGALQALKPGGTLYLGDIRNFTLLEAYHASVQLYRATEDLTRAELVALVQQYMRDEEELLIAPAFFYTLPHRFPQIQGVEVRLKRGHSQNELTRFRYQVLLHLNDTHATPGVQSVALPGQADSFDWQQEGWHLPKLRSYLSQSTELGSKPLLLHNVPNARIQREIRTLAWLAESHPQQVVEWRQQLATRSGGIDPETLWALGEELSYQVHITWSEEAPGRMTVVFYRGPVFLNLGGLGKLTGRLTTPPYANNPLIGKWHRILVPQLREYLQAKLPDYMIPATWVTLETLPLLPNGKVNRAGLPTPTFFHRTTRQPIVPPHTATEQAITQIWRDLLGQVQIGIHDNFYELGGHSLLATQIVSRLRLALQVEIPLNRFLKQPTVAALAQYVDTIKAAQTMLSQNENQPVDSNEEEEIW